MVWQHPRSLSTRACGRTGGHLEWPEHQQSNAGRDMRRDPIVLFRRGESARTEALQSRSGTALVRTLALANRVKMRFFRFLQERLQRLRLRNGGAAGSDWAVSSSEPH